MPQDRAKQEQKLQESHCRGWLHVHSIISALIHKRFKIACKIVKLEQGNNLEVMKSKEKIKGDPHSEGRKKEVQKMHTKEPFPHTCFTGYSFSAKLSSGPTNRNSDNLQTTTRNAK